MFTFDVIPYAGFPFWVILSSFILIHGLFSLQKRKPIFRNIFMIGVSAIIIASALNNSYLILLLFVISSCVFVLGKMISTDSIPNRKVVNIGILAVVIFILSYFRYSDFQSTIDYFFKTLWGNLRSIEAPNKHIAFIGVSYFSFKFIHFLVECYNKKIKDLNYVTFLNYILFFPSFFSGPINRYQFFARDILNEGHKFLSHESINGLKRIINGLFKKIVLAGNLFPYTIAALDLADPSVTPLKAVLGIYAYMFYIYFDFSGYTDMAIGGAGLVGIKLPENFNYPFLKRNLQQFWANWHMSLTTWLTDYVYWPLAKKLRHLGTLKRRPVTVSNICIIITFMICGIWHGDGMNFLLWGTYHGIGLAILNAYTSVEKKYIPNNWKILINKSKIGYGLSTFITFQYVAFGFLLFACNMEKQKVFFQLLFGTTS